MRLLPLLLLASALCYSLPSTQARRLDASTYDDSDLLDQRFTDFHSFPSSSSRMSSSSRGTAPHTPPPSISATGRGVIPVDADLADVAMTIHVKHDLPRPMFWDYGDNRDTIRQTELAVMQELAKHADGVITYLNSNSLCSKLKTTNLNMHREHTWDSSHQKQLVSAVVATQALSCTAAVPNAGKVVSGSVDAGATRVDSVHFRASDAVLNDARQRAVTAATADALRQINSVASTIAALAAETGNTAQQELYSPTRQVVGDINIQGVTQPTASEQPSEVYGQQAFQQAYTRAARTASSAPMPMSAGDQAITATVTAKATYQ